jgi:uncharacterized protein
MPTFSAAGSTVARSLRRRQTCQIFSHAGKFIYFGGLVGQSTRLASMIAGLVIAACILGTSMAKPVLERFTEAQYRSRAGSPR